jgi:hypothetical protein
MELEADQIAKAKFGGLKPKPRLIVKVNAQLAQILQSTINSKLRR